MGKPAEKTDPRALALVLFVITLIAAAVFLRLWANNERLDVPTFRAMATTADGRVLVVVGNTLFVESPQGESLDVIPLSRWGVEDFHGDIAAFADGSVVLAQGRLGAVDAREARRIISRAKSIVDPAEALMRCPLDGDTCKILDGGARIGRAFGMDVDERAGFIYVAEPAKHHLLQLSLSGELLATSDDGWRFPNSIRVLENGRVGFADTDNYRYVEVSIDEDGFGSIARDVGIQGWPDVVPLLNFPSEALKDAANTLWMLVAREAMRDASLYRTPENGMAQKVALPERADPVALAETQGTVLIADQQHFRIHRYDLGGQLQADFGSMDLKNVLAAHAVDHSRFEMIFDYSLLAVLLVALPALLVGLRFQKQANKRAAGPVKENVAVDLPRSMEYSTLAGQYAHVRGEFVFLRKFTVLGTAGDRILTVLLMILILAMFVVLLHLHLHSAERDGVALLEIMGWDDWLMAAGILAAFATMWSSMMFERITITHQGIRYESFMPRVLAHWLWPSWFMRREEIREISVKRKGSGRHPLLWQYEIVDRNGRKRHLHPFSWRLAGESETGLGMSHLLRRNPESMRAVIRGTRLHRLLATLVPPAESQDAA